MMREHSDLYLNTLLNIGHCVPGRDRVLQLDLDVLCNGRARSPGLMILVVDPTSADVDVQFEGRESQG